MTVCVLGSINVDVDILSPRLPSTWNSEVYADAITLRVGGKGFKMARATGWLGGDVVLLGLEGQDNWWAAVKNKLDRTAQLMAEERIRIQSDAVDALTLPGSLTLALHHASTPTGVVAVLQNAIDPATYLAPRERPHWREFDLPPAWTAELQGCSVLLTSLEPPAGLVRSVVSLAKGNGAHVVLNAGPPPRNQPDLAAARELVGMVDVVVLERLEAATLSGQPNADDLPSLVDEVSLLAGQSHSIVCLTAGNSRYCARINAPAPDRPHGESSGAMRLTGSTTDGRNEVLCAGISRGLDADKSPKWSLAFGLAAASMTRGREPVNLSEVLTSMPTLQATPK